MQNLKESDLENQVSFFIMRSDFIFYTKNMQKQDFFSKQQGKNGFSGGVIRHAQPKTNSNKMRAIILVVLVLLIGLGYFYKNQLFTQKLPTPVIETGYTIGTEIQEEGVLTAD